MQATTSTRAPVGTAAFRAPKRAAASPRRPFAPTLPQCQRPLHLARAEGDGGEQPPQQVVEAARRLALPRHSPDLPRLTSVQAAPPKAPEQQQQQQAQQEDEPVWVRRERERQLQKQEGGMRDLPFGAYLLFSSFTAIAAVSVRQPGPKSGSAGGAFMLRIAASTLRGPAPCFTAGSFEHSSSLPHCCRWDPYSSTSTRMRFST